jgi:endonuclease G
MAARNGGQATKRPGKSPDFMEKLKAFVRTRGANYLKDPNISSVGIGFKSRDNQPTEEISIQFTVKRKAQPEELEALETTPIPPTIRVDGIDVPTDVIQRRYERAYKVVSENVAAPRKTRIDPVVPGVSVANRTETAGTLGCIVFDRADATPYILSNWHVLHGPNGRLGDEIVQPGPHDDNRVQLNRLGTLVRSHLGDAGDCAIATIEDRAFEPEIYELKTRVEELGNAELGDKVIKSGRTTGVTHGIVRCVHTLVKIDYGPPIGERAVGGFEIGPDPEHTAPNNEISMGGDSGSVWLFKGESGKATKVMAGLHFAGESGSDPDEHAVACYARSVFEKLEICALPPLEAQAAIPRSGRGYAPGFLGARIDPPRLSAANRKDAFRLNGSEVIDYTHFSLALSQSRRFAFWVAWNIDGSRLKRITRKGVAFALDPRIPAEMQVGDELYAANALDRGHIARRADLTWGSLPEARRANLDSFFFTNITPQMNNFNQGAIGGIWGRLEDAVFDEIDVENMRVSVFAGPVFRRDDREYRGVRIPREFFKILAYVEGGKLQSKAFLLTQNLDQLELLDLSEFKVFQVTLTEIEQRCGFALPTALKAGDSFGERLKQRPEALAERKALQGLAEIEW